MLRSNVLIADRTNGVQEKVIGDSRFSFADYNGAESGIVGDPTVTFKDGQTVIKVNASGIAGQSFATSTCSSKRRRVLYGSSDESTAETTGASGESTSDATESSSVDSIIIAVGNSATWSQGDGHSNTDQISVDWGASQGGGSPDSGDEQEPADEPAVSATTLIIAAAVGIVCAAVAAVTLYKKTSKNQGSKGAVLSKPNDMPVAAVVLDSKSEAFGGSESKGGYGTRILMREGPPDDII